MRGGSRGTTGRAHRPIDRAESGIADWQRRSPSRPTCGPDGRLDSRSPVGSRMRMNELLVGYARPSTEQQDLTAQRDGLHALGVVSKAGPRVRKEVPKASSRNQCPRWLGFVAYVLSAVGTDPGPVDDAAPTADAPTTQSTFPYPSSSCCCLRNRQFLPVPLTGITVSLTAPVSGSVAPTVSQPVCSRPTKNSVGVKRTTVRSCRRRPSAPPG